MNDPLLVGVKQESINDSLLVHLNVSLYFEHAWGKTVKLIGTVRCCCDSTVGNISTKLVTRPGKFSGTMLELVT